MAIIEKVDNYRIIQKEIPDMYVEGKGVRYGSGRRSVRIMNELEDINLMKREEANNFIKLVRLCYNNHWATQTLTKKYGARGYTRGMTIRDIGKFLNLSDDKVYKFLRWAKKNNYLRRDFCGNLVVNPMKILLGNRLSASEYMVYKDEIGDNISSKYKIILEREFSELEKQGVDYEDTALSETEWSDVDFDE